MASPSLPGYSFRVTQHRRVACETRDVFLELFGDLSYGHESRHDLLFSLENSLLRFTANYVCVELMPYRLLPDVALAKLQAFQEDKGTRPDVYTTDLRDYCEGWDLLTATFIRQDYSRTDLLRLVSICEKHNIQTIKTGLNLTSNDKNLSYLSVVLNGIESKQLIQLRRDEAMSVAIAKSITVPLPTFCNPGYITQIMKEEAMFRAIETSVAI